MDVSTLIEGPHNLIPTSAGCIGVLILLTYVFNTFFSKASKQLRRIPPGPKPKPLIGNLFDLPSPTKEATPHYVELSKKYGPILGFNVMGQVMIVINDYDIGKELLDKRSSTFSGRPNFVFAGELAGFNKGIIYAQANDDFRQMRKFVHGQIGSNMALKKWSQAIDLETRRYLLRVLEQPSQFVSHIRNEAASIILKIVYGYQTSLKGDDRLVELIEEVMSNFSEAAVPGKWLVDSIPLLRYVPEWMPGAGFQRIAREYNERLSNALEIPYRFVKNQMKDGASTDSMVSGSLEKGDSGKKLDEHQEKLLKEVSFAMYGGGADTTVAAVEVFYLAMLKFPHVLIKAQEEIDHVLGSSRLPDAEDKARLPYCEAVVKEVLRWNPVGEITVPHVNSEDDEFMGYFIPKGSLIMYSLLATIRDPKLYKEPEKFNPERFLGDNPERDISDITWGFGKRICPGRFLAVANLWMEISRTIACFNIRPIKGAEPSGEFTVGFLRRPVPFKADISVRSSAWEELIREVEITDPWTEGDAKLL